MIFELSQANRRPMPTLRAVAYGNCTESRVILWKKNEIETLPKQK